MGSLSVFVNLKGILKGNLSNEYKVKLFKPKVKEKYLQSNTSYKSIWPRWTLQDKND